MKNTQVWPQNTVDTPLKQQHLKNMDMWAWVVQQFVLQLALLAHNLAINTDITNEFVELKGIFLLIEPVLESEEKIILKNGQSGSSSAFPVKTLSVSAS